MSAGPIPSFDEFVKTKPGESSPAIPSFDEFTAGKPKTAAEKYGVTNPIGKGK